jgi:hypothetical protein
MQYSGLNAQEQWSLLNSNVPLAVLNEHNQAQTQSESTALAARVAASLVNATAQAATARAQAAVGKPTVSTSLQTTTQQRKSDMKQEEYETRFYEKQARRPIVANNPSDTTKTPDGGKPNFDSRDAMEQKKDKAWDKIESTYNPRDAMDRKKDEMWEKVVILPFRDQRDEDVWEKIDIQERKQPDQLPRSLEKYHWYDSYEKAVNAWANFNKPFSKELERCALIYKFTDKQGDQYYTYGNTGIGMNEIPEWGIRDNVATAFLDLYIREWLWLPHAECVGFVHTHPDLPNNDQFSDEDRDLLDWPRIDFISVAPYGDDENYTE